MLRKKKLVLILVLLLGLGFAIITTALYLTGSLSITKNEGDFNVIFAEAKLGDNDITETAIKNEGKSIEYSAEELQQVNDTSNLNLKIKNESTLYDAEVTLECTGASTDYYEFSATIGGQTKKVIKAQHTANGLISIKVKSTTLENINASFTCTLSATALERNVAPGEDPETFVKAYTYNQSKGAENYCVRGDETTCELTDCYKIKEAGSCPAGTIIKYMVNDETEKTFHVMYDDETTITMQDQGNTIEDIVWVTKEDFIAAGGSSTEFENYHKTRGPVTALNLLANATENWTNVNEKTYKLGETEFLGNAYTGCSNYNNCNANTYIMASRVSKARMISVQEAAYFGCTGTQKSCPKWLYNYLKSSESYGGTVNEGSHEYYFTMSAYSSSTSYAYFVINNKGFLETSYYYSTGGAARAVVEVNKE